jgi:hypothetical protein
MNLQTIHFASTAWMCAIIWFVQLVHYPSFKYIHSEKFSSFHSFHSRWTTVLVFPPMLTELVLSSLNFWQKTEEHSLLIFGLTVLTWALTFFISVPFHNQLSKGYNPKAAKLLVQTNWLRVITWTLLIILQIRRISTHLNQ